MLAAAVFEKLMAVHGGGSTEYSSGDLNGKHTIGGLL